MKVVIFLVCLLANITQAQTIGAGLTWSQFQSRFNSNVESMESPSIRLTNCRTKAVPAKKIESSSCEIADAGYVSGLTSAGVLKDVQVKFQAAGPTEFHQFQRSARYLIYATSTKYALGAGTLVTELMQAGMKEPSKVHAKLLEGVKYNYVFEPKDISGPTWMFWTE